MSDAAKPARAWCITWHYDKDDEEDQRRHGPTPDKKEVRYAIWNDEIGADNGSAHWQIYAEFKRPQRFTAVQRLLGLDKTAHCEPRKGTREQARAYCMKEESRREGTQPVEFGDWGEGGQGKRSDLKEAAAAAADTSISMDDVILQHQGVAMRYSKGLSVVRAAAMRQEMKNKPASAARRNLTCCVYWGESRTGKTTKALEEQDLYLLPPRSSSSGTVWFDGYGSQQTILIDDFMPQCIPLQILLNLLDGTPVQQQAKGSFVQPAWTKVIITSNYHPSKWYPEAARESVVALSKRLTEIREFKRQPDRFGGEGGDEPVWADIVHEEQKE